MSPHTMAKQLNTRAAAAYIAWQIIDQGQSLDVALSRHFESDNESKQNKDQDRGFIQELVYGQCRWH